MRQIVDDYSRQEVDRVFFSFPEISAIKSSNYGITNKYMYNNPWFYKRPSIEKSQTRYERVSRVKRDKFLLKVKKKELNELLVGRNFRQNRQNRKPRNICAFWHKDERGRGWSFRRSVPGSSDQVYRAWWHYRKCKRVSSGVVEGSYAPSESPASTFTESSQARPPPVRIGNHIT